MGAPARARTRDLQVPSLTHQPLSHHVSQSGKRGLLVIASNLGPGDGELELRPVHPRCFIGQDTSLSCWLCPHRCINGLPRPVRKSWGSPYYELASHLGGAAILHLGRFMPVKPEISTPDGPLGANASLTLPIISFPLNILQFISVLLPLLLLF